MNITITVETTAIDQPDADAARKAIKAVTKALPAWAHISVIHWPCTCPHDCTDTEPQP